MKKLTALAVVFAMLFTTVFASPLSDISGHWAESEINAAYEKKMVSGDEDGSFRPEDKVSRGEFMKMVTAVIAENFSLNIPEASNSSHWAEKYYDFATSTYLTALDENKYDGVFPGAMSKDNFDLPIERWEMAYILDCALTAGYGVHYEDGDFSRISDMSELNSGYDSKVLASMKSMVTLGIIAGDENGRFNASLGGTRAEAVVMLNRVLKITDEIHKYFDDLQKQQEETLNQNLVTYDEIPSGHPVVEFTMSGGGKFEITLYPEYAPQTCANFLKLVGDGFYNGLTFHRVVDDFMAQGGDPNGDGTGGAKNNIVGEFAENGFLKNELKHEAGTVSMARSQLANSASSQFFICYDDLSYLDGQYAAFGKVTSGMKTVENFLKVEREYNSAGELASPKTPIKILKAVVKKK